MCNVMIGRPASSFSYSTTGWNFSSTRSNQGYTSETAGESGRATTGGLSLSREARALMSTVTLMASLMGGDFGALMKMLSGPMGANRDGTRQAIGTGNPGFGETERNRALGGPRQAEEVGSNAPKVAPGQSKELKEGESVRGAHGTQLTWGTGDNVDIKYKAKNGQMKTIKVQNGMISFDGGKPQKLENTGQMLKLPNGDVVAIGNQTDNKGGKDMCRVVMADSPDKVACDPPSATNIYDVEQMERKYSSREGGGISMNLTSGSLHTPGGEFNFASLNANIFLGREVQHSDIQQRMRFNSMK